MIATHAGSAGATSPGTVLPPIERPTRRITEAKPCRWATVRHDMRMGKEAESSRAARVVRLLEDNVRTELRVMNSMLELDLSDATIERLVEGVASGVLYAFNVDWSPDWMKPGQVHAWEEGGVFFARCSGCLLDSPPAESRPSAEDWARQHESLH